jgi:hypothetical protein
MIAWLMNMEQLAEWEFTRETEVLEENLPQCHFIHHKSYMASPGIEPEQPLCRRPTACATSRPETVIEFSLVNILTNFNKPGDDRNPLRWSMYVYNGRRVKFRLKFVKLTALPHISCVEYLEMFVYRDSFVPEDLLHRNKLILAEVTSLFTDLNWYHFLGVRNNLCSTSCPDIYVIPNFIN